MRLSTLFWFIALGMTWPLQALEGEWNFQAAVSVQEIKDFEDQKQWMAGSRLLVGWASSDELRWELGLVGAQNFDDPSLWGEILSGVYIIDILTYAPYLRWGIDLLHQNSSWDMAWAWLVGLGLDMRFKRQWACTLEFQWSRAFTEPAPFVQNLSLFLGITYFYDPNW